MERIACYIRVSTDKDEQRHSLKQQKALLEKQYEGSEIEMYSDTGSGTNFNREGFKNLLWDCGLDNKLLGDGRLAFEASRRESKYDEIVVISTSRFARNIGIIDILRVLWDYKKVNVKFLDVKKDSNNPNDMILLQMFFAMAENEATEISKRTRRGNQVTAMQNKIRNNQLFGYDFDRVKNKLVINEEEANVVRFLFEHMLENGYKKTGELANEKGYRTRKGNKWTQMKVKILVLNPKYKGYNVRNKYSEEAIFTNKNKRALKPEEWLVQKNDRIEPIISEKLFEDVQNAIKIRTKTLNRGENARIYDTRCKIKCSKCGANYIRCVNRYNAKKDISTHYLVCANKKRYTKSFCDSINIKVKMVNDFIDEQRAIYSKNIQLQIHFAIVKVEDEIRLMNDNKNSAFEIKSKENILEELKDKLDSLVDNFLGAKTETMQEIITRKIKELENNIIKIENEIDEIKLKINDRDKYFRELTSKLRKLKEELYESKNSNVLTREEYLKKVKAIYVIDKEKFEVEYIF